MLKKIRQFLCFHNYETLKDKKLIEGLEIEVTHRCTKCGNEFKHWYFNPKDVYELKEG